MKQNIIIVTVLAALSMVNGIPLQLHKRATTFAACPAGSPTPLDVTITPDPPAAGDEVTTTISGTPTAEIADGANLVFSILDQADALQGKAVTTPFCTAEGVTCPVAAGTAFTASQPVTLPETLPEGPYKLQVAIVDAAGASIGCSVGTVTDAAAPADDAPAGGDDGAEPPADGDDGAEPPAGGDDAPADDAPADDAPADDAPADDA